MPVFQVPVLLASRTLRTGGTRFVQAPRYPIDLWRLSAFMTPGTLRTGGDSVRRGPHLT